MKDTNNRYFESFCAVSSRYKYLIFNINNRARLLPKWIGRIPEFDRVLPL